MEDPEVAKWIKQLDSLNTSKQKQRDTIYPFNPNFITDSKAYQLGMNLEETDRLFEYRNAGRWVNSAEDFQKVTGISDSLLNLISPSFRFPQWTRKSNFSKVLKESSPVQLAKTDLNSASATDLKSVSGVGDVLAARIVKYRYSIGGFRDGNQLKDVYGLSEEVIARILQGFEVKTRPDDMIKNINSISLAELSEMPYFNYELARKVIEYRNLHEGIRSFEELLKINDFPSDKIERIKLYLTIN